MAVNEQGLADGVSPKTEESDPELEFLTRGLKPEDQKAVTRAFHTFAKGDPKGFPVGLTTLLKAHAASMEKLPDAVRGAAAGAVEGAVEEVKATLADTKRLASLFTRNLQVSNENVEQIKQTAANVQFTVLQTRKDEVNERHRFMLQMEGRLEAKLGEIDDVIAKLKKDKPVRTHLWVGFFLVLSFIVWKLLGL